MLYTTEAATVRCGMCLRRCAIPMGKAGFCRTRIAREGKLWSLVYGRVAALHVAEVERKPLFHFYPGKAMLSVGTLGCTFACPGCQNAELSHAEVEAQLASCEYVEPARLVEMARGTLGISWTYNEPAVWFEYTLDGARLAKQAGLMTNYVTNGSMSPEALDAIAPVLDAYRADIKGYAARTYRRIARFGEPARIRQNAERAKHRYHMHVECVTNVTPGLNDSSGELRNIARWIAQSLGPETPWHVTRFVPHLELGHLPLTPVEKLEEARAIGMAEGLEYVYVGNVPGHPAENTYCPKCGALLIDRASGSGVRVQLAGNRCGKCGTEIAGRF
jgi:pyruvate formate lyase activating enzyme